MCSSLCRDTVCIELGTYLSVYSMCETKCMCLWACASVLKAMCECVVSVCLCTLHETKAQLNLTPSHLYVQYVCVNSVSLVVRLHVPIYSFSSI